MEMYFATEICQEMEDFSSMEDSLFSITEQEILDASVAPKKSKAQLKSEKKAKEDQDQKIVREFYDDPSDRNFARIFNRFNYGLRQYVFGFFKDNDIIGEVVSKTFIRAWEKRDSYSFEYRYSTWLYNICKNFCLGDRAAMAKRNHIDIDISDCYASTLFRESEPNTAIEANLIFNISTSDADSIMSVNREEVIQQFYDASIKAIEEYPVEVDKVLMTMKFIECKTLDTIAEETGYTIPFIRNHIYKGQKYLRDIIRNNNKDLYENYLDALAAAE